MPLALYLDPQTGKAHPKAAQWMEEVANAVEQEGVEAWWSSPDSRWVDEPVVRVDDVLDVWLDGGCVPALLGQADVVVEGVDQFRGWFQSCLWVAAALGWEEPPFKRVVAHGSWSMNRGGNHPNPPKKGPSERRRKRRGNSRE